MRGERRFWLYIVNTNYQNAPLYNTSSDTLNDTAGRWI